MRRRFATTCALSLAITGCAPQPSRASAPPPERPAAREKTPDPAWTRLRELLRLPRAAGAPGREASLTALSRALERAGAERVDRLDFHAWDPWIGREVPLANLVGWVRPQAPHLLILASHFDTPPVAHADPDPARRGLPVPGANDGTSGVAVILAALPTLARRLPPAVGLAAILFDGEELGTPEGGGYLAGSRDLGRRLQDGQLPDLARAEAALVLDMVGARDLAILRDPASARAAPGLQDLVWATAARLGEPTFVDAPGPAVGDDHLPLIEAGLPAVLLIDRDDPRWHTTADDLDGVSPASLASVRRVVVTAALAWARPYARGTPKVVAFAGTGPPGAARGGSPPTEGQKHVTPKQKLLQQSALLRQKSPFWPQVTLLHPEVSKLPHPALQPKIP